MRGWLVFLLLPLAGCVSDDGGPDSTARESFAISDNSASSRYDYSLFIGITGSEGPLNLTDYKAALTKAGGNQALMAKTFELTSEDSSLGDGRVHSWYTTHFAYHADAQLIGGLISQVKPDGSLHTLLAPFRGPYGGSVTLATQGRSMAAPLQDSIDAMSLFMQETADETVLCTLTTRTEDWNIDSPQAADIALSQPAMIEHLLSYPSGELTYYYFPGLAVAPDCPATLDAEDNYWLVMHTDLDVFMDPTTPDPSLATVRIDAETGAVLDVEVAGLVQLHQPFEAVIDHTDPTLPPPDWTTIGIPILVQDGANVLTLDVSRSQRPAYLIDEEIRLVAPSGDAIMGQPLYSSERFEVSDPGPGEWQFEYRYRSATPNGHHVVSVNGDVYYG